MTFLIRFWATLIGLIFVVTASVLSVALALVSTIILFASALIVIPFFFFAANAPALADRVTEIVVSPLRICGRTVSTLWSQLWMIAAGKHSEDSSDEATRLIASAAIRLALSVLCLAAIAAAPISGSWQAFAFALTSGALIVVWTVSVINWTSDSDGSFVDNTIGVVIVLMAISASVLTAIAFAPMAVHWEVIAYVVAGIILVVGWVGGIVAMTES